MKLTDWLRAATMQPDRKRNQPKGDVAFPDRSSHEIPPGHTSALVRKTSKARIALESARRVNVMKRQFTATASAGGVQTRVAPKDLADEWPEALPRHSYFVRPLRYVNGPCCCRGSQLLAYAAKTPLSFCYRLGLPPPPDRQLARLYVCLDISPFAAAF